MSPIFIPLFAFCATALLIIILRPLALWLGLVDVPNSRKSHSGQIPLIGGIAIFSAMLLSLLGHLFYSGSSSVTDPSLYFILGGLLLIICGVWDDFVDLSAYSRFGTQIIAALMMIYGGNVVLTDLGEINPLGGTFQLGYMSVPFTIFATLGIINAVNMCDGLDGLSGSLSLVSLLGLGAANIFWGNTDPVIGVMAASICAFLLFNMRTIWRKKAWVFLGDAGSMLIGFTLCWLAISMSQGADRVINPGAALWFLMVPIFDAVSMMIRRILHKRSPFSADKEHLHHVFLFAGFSVGETVFIMSGIALAGIFVGLGGMFLGISDLVMVLAFFILGMLYFWVIMRAWKVMKFLRRSICRRQLAHNSTYSLSDRRQNRNSNYSGPERRSGIDRRKQPAEYKKITE